MNGFLLRSFALACFCGIFGSFLPAQAQSFPDRPDFFEEGYRQLEREIQQLQRSRPDSVLSINAAGWQWQQFISQKGGFQVWLPLGSLSQLPTEQIETPFGVLELESFSSEQNHSMFGVAYSQPAAFLATADPEAIVTVLSDRITENREVNLVRREEIDFNGGRAWELTFEEREELSRMRAFFVGDRVYLLAVLWQEEEDFSPVLQAFFESFELIDISGKEGTGNREQGSGRGF